MSVCCASIFPARLVDDVQGNEMQCKFLVFVLQVLHYQQRSFAVFHTPFFVNVSWTCFLITLGANFDSSMHFIGLQTAWNHKRSNIFDGISCLSGLLHLTKTIKWNNMNITWNQILKRHLRVHWNALKHPWIVLCVDVKI